MKWARLCVLNIAAMGEFSIDKSVHKYAKEIWHLEPLPIDKKELEDVKEEYSQYDRCRIL